MGCRIEGRIVVLDIWGWGALEIPIEEIESIEALPAFPGLGFREVFYIRFGSLFDPSVILRRRSGLFRGFIVPHPDPHRFVFEVKRLGALPR